MPSRVARLRLAQGVESQFDTAIVAAFEAVLAGATEDYRLARREDFTLVRAGSILRLPDGEGGRGVARRRLAAASSSSVRTDGLGARPNTHLRIDVSEVRLRSSLADEERAGDLSVRGALNQ